MSELPYTRQEMMAIAAGRELRDGELAILALACPCWPAILPRRTTRPDCAR